MTGQVFASTPPHRVSVAYSIDSFSEYSTSAVSRTPTRAIVPPSSSISFNTCMDEELFRDLFADADAETEQRDVVFGAGFASPLKRNKANTTPNKSMTWHTGATLVKPFASPPPPEQPRNQVSAAVAQSSMAPSLSVPLPRQSAVDLITARPQTLATEDNPELTQLGLSRVPEVNEEEEDDELVAALSTKSKSARRVVAPVGPLFSSKMPGSASIKNETLQFLEKLDLKLLLAQPRPDVTNFLPSNNQTNHAFHDSRIEDSDHPSRPVASIPLGAPSRKPLSSRKEPLHPLPEGSTRLAHMAHTYGTTTGGPRKTRKETIERLSNPIMGHTSTLQALSPDARKKREAELGSWPPADVPVTPVKTLTSKKTRDLIERLAEAQNSAPASSRGGVKKLIKGKKPTNITVRTMSNNNQDDTEDATKSGAKPRQATLDERKAMLKQKLGSRSSKQTEPSAAAVGGSTFLTQHEDTEAKLSSSANNLRRSNRKLVPQRPKDAKLTQGSLHLPQRPVIPPLARPRASSSTTGAPTPSRTSKSTSGANNNARAPSTVKEIRGAVSAASPHALGASRERDPIGPPRYDRKRIVSSRKKGQGTDNSASSVLLGTTARDISRAPPGSSEKSRNRSKSGVTKPKAPSEPPQGSLPLIRRPAPAPHRPAAPAAGRTHRIRSSN